MGLTCRGLHYLHHESIKQFNRICVPSLSKRQCVQFSHRAQEVYNRKHSSKIEEAEVPLKTLTSNEQLDEVKVQQASKNHKPPQPNLAAALIRTFGPMYIVGSGFKLIHDCLMFISPMLLR